MLLYCVPKVIQVGAEFQVHLRMDVGGMKVRQLPCLCASPSSCLLQKPLLWGVAAARISSGGREELEPGVAL